MKIMAQLLNARIIATDERLQVYQSATNSEIFLSPKYPGRGFTLDEIEILGEA